jgi:putative membrane protein
MGTAFYDDSLSTPEQRQQDLERLSKCTWAFVRSMKRHLSPEWEDEIDFQKELYQRLPESQAKAILDAAHRPNRALHDLSLAIEQLPMHFIRKDEMHKALTIFEDNLGSSERLLTSPVPIFYNRHVARFLFLWHLFLPFGMWDTFKGSWNHVIMIPSIAIFALFMFGIEELATQMEEPFTILPMQAFCDKIGNWCNEIVSWKDGDNGLTTRRTVQGHSGVYFESPETGNVLGRRM